ncbi:MAG: AmmeMemoRadiSam system protein B [Anaerolineae bacterium]|nr:AmmeMemoRadiSam system protein B [Anaerolineae bacterium]
MTTAQLDNRPSALAGMWYPADAQALRALVAGYLAQADSPRPDGKIIGLLAPHAGLRYSGPVAAHAFKLLEGQTPDVIALLCPYHRPPPAAFSYPAATTSHAAYQTPLGSVAVDRAGLAQLAEELPILEIERDEEHALEIELPFLQVVLQGEFQLLPLMLLDQSPAFSQALGQALAATLRGRNALLIASSDLSHFFPQAQAKALDTVTLDAIRAYDPRRVIQTGKAPGEGACGRGAIAAVMWAAGALGANSATILHYATSGDTSGDYQRVVGYAAGVFHAVPE